MANWYGTARSNYFLVKDDQKFLEWASTLPIDAEKCNSGEDEGKWMIYSTEQDSGGWPSYRYDEESEEYIEVDWPSVLSAHLQENEVAILMEAGAEKLRYVTGVATAIAWTGEVISLSLSDIYRQASEGFGVPVTMAEY